MEIKSVELASDLPECPRFGKLQNCFGAYNHFNGNNISANGRTMNGMGKAQKSQFVGRHMLENTRTVKETVMVPILGVQTLRGQEENTSVNTGAVK